MYDTYIFDLYGTLIDIETDEENAEVWERLSLHFSYQGMNITGAELKERYLQERDSQLAAAAEHCEHPDFVMEEVFRALARDLGGEPGQAWLHETVRWMRTLSMIHISLYDGVAEILGQLRSRGKRCFCSPTARKPLLKRS